MTGVALCGRMHYDQIKPAPARPRRPLGVGGGDEAEHEIYADVAVCDYPQCGERIPAMESAGAARTP